MIRRTKLNPLSITLLGAAQLFLLGLLSQGPKVQARCERNIALDTVKSLIQIFI